MPAVASRGHGNTGGVSSLISNLSSACQIVGCTCLTSDTNSLRVVTVLLVIDVSLIKLMVKDEETPKQRV